LRLVESLIRTAQGWRAWGLTESDAVVLRPLPGLVAGQRVTGVEKK